MKPATTAFPVMLLILATTAQAQTRSLSDTTTAYGARLTNKGAPAALNQNRINSRINNRIDNRLSLRIERYRPEANATPIEAFKVRQDDRTRTAPVTPPQTPGSDPD